MALSTDTMVVIGGLAGVALIFVPLGYFVRRWWLLLVAEFLIAAAIAVAAAVWPAGYELDTGALLGLVLIPPVVIAMICTGLGIALRSVIAPRPDE